MHGCPHAIKKSTHETSTTPETRTNTTSPRTPSERTARAWRPAILAPSGFCHSLWVPAGSDDRLLKAMTRSCHRRGFPRRSPAFFGFLRELFCFCRLALRSAAPPIGARAPPWGQPLQEVALKTIFFSCNRSADASPSTLGLVVENPLFWRASHSCNGKDCREKLLPRE